MINLPPEKLGSFYLGATYDDEKNEVTDEAVNYDARDLTTHAVCVGMTGSGKTGLCIGLLEEAAIDKVPAIIIDPKGDMTNLLLQFESLDASDFEPWVNRDDAGRKGMTLKEYAAKTAETWKNGLENWGQGTDRIKLLKDSVDYTIYTPGSDTGVPINILGSFAAPGIDFDSDAEMLRERIQGTVAALLGMINSKEDPVRSREGILLANIFEHHWRQQEDLDLTKLIMGIQNPPVKKLGVFDVDTFFPEKDRFELAMAFNTLVASPQFSYWLQGDPLDIDKIYFTSDGKPRHSIFYIAHLSESERMFFVTLLLNSLITWMRRQSGTSSLRSLLYFDEIFGYFPPTAQPPSKRPLLTILKQARAFGVGAVLVTQNPVDIDYKGLSNAGTWFIGKLQTERDKDRVLQGLEGAIAEAGTSDDTDFDTLISSLKSRVFLMHNVHEDEPILMHTRWVMSYLRGPLTRPQVKQLMKDHKQRDDRPELGTREKNAPVKKMTTKEGAIPPVLDSDIDQRFFAVWKSASEAGAEIGGESKLSLQYQPMLLSTGKVRFYDTKRDIDSVKSVDILSTLPDEFGRIDWEQSIHLSNWKRGLLDDPDHPEGVSVAYDDLPDTIDSAKELKKAEDTFSDYLYHNERMKIHQLPSLKIYQGADEGMEAFRMRISHAARELRDEAVDELQDKFEDKLDRITDRIRKKEYQLEEHQSELSHRKTAEIVGVAETLFSLFKGRRRSISSATTKSRMRRKASQKLESARIDLEELHADYRELENEMQEKINKVKEKWANIDSEISVLEIKPRRADVVVDGVYLVWNPFWTDGRGSKVSARG